MSVRLTFIAVASMAVGSWLGLGKPTTAQARSLATWPNLTYHAPPDPDRAWRAPPPVMPPGPQALHPESVTSLKRWPELNPQASIERAWLVAEGPDRRRHPNKHLVTLTFDDGPFPETVPDVLDLLRRYRVHATFFVIGQYLDGDDGRARRTRALLREIVAEGHLVGNHTHDHARLPLRSHAEVAAQIDDGAASIERAIGKRPVLFRPPFGELDAFGEKLARERHLDVILWSVDPGDMLREDSHQMFQDVVEQLEYERGGIVILHDIRRTSVAVLEELLPWLHDHRWDPKHPSREGYAVVDLPTYLRAVEAAPQPFANREELQRARSAEHAARRARREEREAHEEREEREISRR